MNRTLLLAGTALALSAVVLLWWFLRTPKDTFADDVHTQFAYEHVDRVQRIFIADWGQNQAEVQRGSDGQWTYTNKITGKQFPARPDAIRNLLETIQNVRVRFLVAAPAVDNVIKSMTGKSRKVEIYDDQGNRVRAYNVGGPASRDEGTYMLMDSSNRPCVVYLPSWVGSVHTRYIVEEDLWRDRALFRINPQTLETVQVEYHDPLQMQHSFKLLKTGAESYQVEPISVVTKKMDASLQNNDNIATYIEDFDNLVGEIIVYNKPLRDSIIAQKPFATIQFKTKEMAEAKQFRLFPIFNPGADRGDGRVGTRQKIERYYADMGEDNFYIVQHPVVLKLLWGYTYFFQTDKVAVE